MTTPLKMPGALIEARDAAITAVSGFSDHRLIAVAAHWGIEYEKFLRAYVAAYPRLVRALWGLASRDEQARLSERISALEDTVRQLEAKVDKR